jgi:hypothetical protein
MNIMKQWIQYVSIIQHAILFLWLSKLIGLLFFYFFLFFDFPKPLTYKHAALIFS